MKYFSKDKEQLAHALAHMFDLTKFYIAVESEAVAAIAACTDGVKPPIRLDKSKLRKHLGLIRG
ncbi:MAG: hypothetical protein LBU32_17465 [Clostridiales bacterium]|nr:hypothetical protein [Clostridiales bacterium]